MNNQIKNALAIVVGIVILILAYSAYIYSDSFSKSIQPSSFRSFATTGEGKVTAIPDVAEFTFSIITQGGKDLASLQKTNTDKLNAAIDFVKSQGVDSKDITTQNYSVDPRYQYFNCGPQILSPTSGAKPCPPPEIVGYTITQTVLVKVRDFTKIGDILSGIVNKGANSVSQLSFAIDNPDTYKNQARDEAIQKAKEKAQEIAKVGGFSLGKLLSIDEGYISPAMPIYNTKAEALGMGGITASAPAPTIEPGSQEITVDITLRYEIQ